MALLLVWSCLSCTHIFAQGNLLCAQVTIEIEQEVTLEREAFEARMTVTNGLNVALNDIEVDVLFTDEDGNKILATNNPDADPDVYSFFIRPEDPVPASIPAGEVSRMTWVIIPTIQAGGEDPQGLMYFVGADLRYKIGTANDPELVQVSPDFIFVKPLPDLQLDYFLPIDVFGDDPRTSFLIEPSIPFSLGLRIKNVGFGIAQAVKVESAQPRIVENELGLLVGFQIEDTEVNGALHANTLLADFGDIAPATEGTSGMARWLMTSTLSGQFVEFTASVTHGDELGGELTAIIRQENLNTHVLVRDVLVDLPGRDSVRDFLSLERNGQGQLGLMQVFESNGTESDVNDVSQPALPPLPSAGGGIYRATIEGGAGFFYTKYIDPFAGAKVLTRVTRNDGKVINTHNAWFDRTWDKDNEVWEYWFHIFDANTGGTATYDIVVGDPVGGNEPPQIAYIADKNVEPGNSLGFIIRASDDQAPPVVRVENLPAGATFELFTTNENLSTYQLQWTPSAAQYGTYPVRFVADDGLRQDSRVVNINVTDSAYDAWKEKYFGALVLVDDFDDPDLDGMYNLMEYFLDLNPLVPDSEYGPQFDVDEFNGEFYVTLTFEHRTDDPSLQFEVKGASSRAPGALMDSDNVTVPVSQADVRDGLVRVKIRDTHALGTTSARRFLVLNVSRN